MDPIWGIFMGSAFTGICIGIGWVCVWFVKGLVQAHIRWELEDPRTKEN